MILLKFSTFTGLYVLHCHNLQHEDHAMMGVFNVGAVPDNPLEFEQGEHAGESPPDGPFVPEIPADADPPEFGPPPGLID